MADDQAAVIEVKDVSFAYEGTDTRALDQVNMTINSGEFVAFIGQNGAGKTTLAKTFNGILEPTEGQVLVRGEDTRQAGLDRLARVVGYVYQNPDHQIFSTTVKDEVAFGPRNLGWDQAAIDKAVSEALELVNMQDEAASYPLLLGRGQRQKVAVASVIAMGPPVLVVDEPTTGLDLNGSLGIMNLLRHWNADGRTIIIITHDMNIVAEFAPRTVVMADGRVLADGPTREVLTDQELLARAFLRSPQITRLAQSLDARHKFPHQILTIPEFYAELKQRLNQKEGG